MSCARALRPIILTLETDQTTVEFAMGDDWEPLEDAAIVDFSLVVQGLSGNFVVKPASQLAVTRAEVPDAPAAISAGSYINDLGYTAFHETSAGGTGKLLGRFGVAYKLSSAGANAGAQVILQPYVKSCFRLLPGRTALVNPGAVTTTDANYAELTEFLPAAGLSKVKVAFFVNADNEAYLEYALFLRSATDPRKPNAWQLVDAAWIAPSASSTERNTGQLSPPAEANLTSNTLFQLAVGYRKKSGAAGNPRATISAIPGVLYA